jgi:hypothetical protein
MMALIERAIDTSIVTFKTKGFEQSCAENETEETILTTEPPIIPANAQAPEPENNLGFVQGGFHAPGHISVSYIHDSADPTSTLIQSSSRVISGSESITQGFSESNIFAHDSVLVDHQSEGDHLVRGVGHGGETASISTSNKGKETAKDQSHDEDYDEEFSLEQDPLVGNNRFAWPNDLFYRARSQQGGNINFEDFFFDSGLGN